MQNGSRNTTTGTDYLNQRYVSSIKVAGISLLPPLISRKMRIELKNDKEKAIEIERYIMDVKKFNKQHELENKLTDNANACDNSLDNFDDDYDISHINALNVTSPSISNDNKQNLPFNVVPFLDKNESGTYSANYRKHCDDDEISELDNIAELSASTVELDLTEEVSLKSPNAENLKRLGYPLMRNKTFVLSAPSPVLLKHFQDCSTLRLCSNASNTFDLGVARRLNLCNINSSIESKYEDNETVISETSQYPETRSQSVTTQDSFNYSVVSNNENRTDEPDDFSLLKMPDIFFDSKLGGLVTLQNSQCHNSSFSNNNALSDIEHLDEPANEEDNQSRIVQVKLNSDFCEGPSVLRNEGYKQLLAFGAQNVIASDDLLVTSMPNLIDFDSDNCDTCIGASFRNDATTPRIVYDVENVVSPMDLPNIEVVTYRPDKAQRKLKEQWAAGILTAAAKGYLVRRLKRTERVQNLIQTIRDALLCALSLHTESSESIQNSDVELHRRLIQQVSAACYEFYEIFFSLTIKEKMDLIALDRQRIQEKLKRPKSGTNLKIESNRSTPKSQRRSMSARQKKSLTPTFAA